MNFELDAVFIEEDCRASALADRVVKGLPASVPLSYVADGREVARPQASSADPFGTGKRRMVVMRRRSPFLMACPAASAEFACCGYLVLALASNCPMDCSYCFLQEYVADNPSFQVYANYAEAFEELERMTHQAPGRDFRVGTGELADSLAFDRLTGISRDLVEYFARGNALLKNAHAAVRARLADILKGLSPAELATLHDTLGLLQRSFPEMPAVESTLTEIESSRKQ